MPNFKDAAKNIATLGYHSYRKSLQLESKLDALHKNASSQQIGNGSSQVVNVSDGATADRPVKKPNVKQLREFSRNSVWARAALDIYRDVVANAEPQIVPVDRDKKQDQGVKREIEELLGHPNELNQPYSE